MRLLKDPSTGREVYLIGSTHGSQMLANRTGDLIREVQPDQVYVQTNAKWVETVKSLEGVHTQHQLNDYNLHLANANDFHIPLTFRGMLFRFRLYPWLLSSHFIKAFSRDFHPFIPGMEMKQAVTACEEVKAQLVLGGLELDDLTVDRLFHEKRMDLVPFLYRLQSLKSTYNSEKFDNYAVLKNQGGEAFAESIDSYRANWFTNFFSIIAPHQKDIIVDQKDIDIFQALYNCKSKKTVAVVN